jgi:hypothetical protein
MTGISNYGALAGFNWSNYALNSPPSPPAPPTTSPPPPAPAPKEEVETIIVPGIRNPQPVFSYRPLPGGGRPPLTLPPPPLPPAPEGTEVVVVTGPRSPRYSTRDEAIGAAITIIGRDSRRNQIELGMFIQQDVAGFYLSRLYEATPETPDQIELPLTSDLRNAVGYVHSHPPGVIDPSTFAANRGPSQNDLNVWRRLQEFTGNEQFKMWIIGPDGVGRQYDSISEVPIDQTRTPVTPPVEVPGTVLWPVPDLPPIPTPSRPSRTPIP